MTSRCNATHPHLDETQRACTRLARTRFFVSSGGRAHILMASPPDAASLLAALAACADPAAASRDAAALAAFITQDEAAEAWLCEPAHARDAVHTLSRVLVEHGAQLGTDALAGACTAISVALESALDGDADDAVLQACRGVCAACRYGGTDALSATAGLVALLASVGTPATRDMLRAEAAPHLVAAMCDNAGVAGSAACVALHYLTQDGAALVIARLPGVGAALGAALCAAAEDEESGEAARAAAAALAHVAADAQCAALLAPAAAGAVAALETHAANAGCVRWLAAAIAKLADAGAAEARTHDACAAVARALALHSGVPALRAPLLAALVAAAASEAHTSALLMNGAASSPFTLETRASGIAGAGSGLFVASGEVPAGAVVALYPGEVWASAPPSSVAAGNEYLAASPGGGFADGSPAAVARAAAAATARGAPELGARAAAHMANHPANGTAPNCIFLELAMPLDALLRAPAAAPDGGAPCWVLCLLAAQALPRGTEVTVDYRIDAARAPAWFTPVPEHLALL